MPVLRTLLQPTSIWNPARDPRQLIRYVDVSSVSRDQLAIGKVDPIRSATAPSRARKVLKAGDTIVATIRPGLKRVAKVPADLDGEIASTAFCVLRPNRELIDEDFLFFVASSDAFIAAVAEFETGASYPAVRDADVLDRDVQIPYIEKQRKIASVLRTALASLKSQTDVLTSLQALKQSTMAALFTRGLRGEAQKETEIGWVPESWEVNSLGEHHRVCSGGTPSRGNTAYWSEGSVPWVKTTEVNYCIISKTEEHITQHGLNESAAKLLPAGTLLMAMYGQGVTRGRVAILGIDAACNQACAAINSTDGVVKIKYLYHFLSWRYEAIRQLAHGGQQQNLNLDIVRALLIAAPGTLEEQLEIIDVLDAIEKKIALHQQKRTVLEELFKALLHQLMTGEIDVNDLDLTALSAI